MSTKFFILLKEFADQPTSQVGKSCKSISEIKNAGISVPKAICIPIKTLKNITEENNLVEKIYKLIQNNNSNNLISKNKTSKKIKNLIIKQKISKEFSKEFLKLYHSYLESSFVSVQSSDAINEKAIVINNIKGDVNVIDVFLEIWAKIVEKTIKKQIAEKQTLNKIINKTHNLDKILFSSPILIQQQINTEISGAAITFDENDGSKKRFTIKGVWGVVNNNLKDADTYIVDSRTFSLIKKHIKFQTNQFTRDLENFKKQKIAINQQNSQVLSIHQINKLAKIISQIKKLSLSQLKISWGLHNGSFFIYNIKNITYFKQNSKNKETNLKKIYVNITKNQDNEIAKKYANGICILNSGQLLSLLDNHPIHNIKSSQKKFILEATSKTIIKYLLFNETFHSIYRLQNLTSLQLSKLKYSTNYEVKEANPYLGIRGALKIIGQPQIFNFELEIIKKILLKTKNKFSLLIPFVRSTDELAFIIKQIEKSNITKNKNFNIWLELSTPENVLNLLNYPLNKIDGVVFNLKSIYSLLLGIDPTNSDVFSRYQKNKHLIIDLIKKTSESVNTFSKKKSLIEKKKILINLSDYDLGILNDILEINIDGIIVDSKVTEIAKKCIINKENTTIL